ncbi:hypothetical protein SHI21_03285 [Bacteriovorax sp. PP10]|uniref:Lipoprotein n=1 Tax=Bacteriovorax antarcticus TaxID=3088717 RepID=A0ABU5VQ87_9BACT|nr:hypothetical protein [Bacteriovorax sp. PP10]MEA9355204.1 hypothetical protein [Bacteriovorax sp. PP10]
MKKLLLSLMVLATLASCGKDNKVSSGSTSLVNVSNPLVTSNPYAQELVTRINNPAAGFGEGLIYSSASSNQTCGTKWGFINYCYGSSGSTSTTTGLTWNALAAQRPTVVYQYSTGRTVRHSDVSIATKQAELIALLNSASNIQVAGTLYYIQVSGAYYVIDTRYPIQANPSAVSNGYQTEYFYQAI